MIGSPPRRSPRLAQQQAYQRATWAAVRTSSSSSSTSSDRSGLDVDGSATDELGLSGGDSVATTRLSLRLGAASPGGGPSTPPRGGRGGAAYRRKDRRQSRDYQHHSNAQDVDDITLASFYKPRTVTLVCACLATLAYLMLSDAPAAATDDPAANAAQRGPRAWRSFMGVSVCFMTVSLLVMPNGPFIRPHPSLWRLVLGAATLYVARGGGQMRDADTRCAMRDADAQEQAWVWSGACSVYCNLLVGM